MKANKNIDCTVHDCKYCDCSCNKCCLNCIKVGPSKIVIVVVLKRDKINYLFLFCIL